MVKRAICFKFMWLFAAFFTDSLCVKSNSNFNQNQTDTNLNESEENPGDNWNYFILMTIVAFVYFLRIVAVLQFGRRLGRTGGFFGGKKNNISKNDTKKKNTPQCTDRAKGRNSNKGDASKNQISPKKDLQSFDYSKIQDENI